MMPLLWPVLAFATAASAIQVRTNLSEVHGREQQQFPFHWPFPFPNPFASVDPNATRVQKLENDADSAYYAEMWVGGQKVKALLDSGSFELLVFGKECSECGKTLYDHSRSRKANVTDFQTSHSYGSGTTTSVLAYDQLSVGGVNLPAQQFWEVVDADMGQLARGAFQSIFGVGPPASAVKFAEEARAEIRQQVKELRKEGEELSRENKQIVQHFDDMVGVQKRTVSVIQNLAFENLSFCFGRQSGSAGYVFWNDHASRDEPEKFLTLDVVGDGYWSAKMAEVRVGEWIEVGCTDNECNAVIDTGTSLIAAPTATVDQIWEMARAWEASGGTCNDLSDMPDLTFELNGQGFRLPPEAYMGWSNGPLTSDVQKYMPQLHDKRRKLRRALIKSRRAEQGVSKGDDDYVEEDAWGLDDDQSNYDDDYDYESTTTDGSEPSICAPLLMYNNVDSPFGQVWILGMPFFRTFYTTFHFRHNASRGPEAASMAFSVADGKCRPGKAPGAQQALEFDSQGANVSQRASREARPATMHVNARRLRVPAFRKAYSIHPTDELVVAREKVPKVKSPSAAAEAAWKWHWVENGFVPFRTGPH